MGNPKNLLLKSNDGFNLKFLQLIIFCIIQYFEINSIQEARKKNA